MPFMNGSLRLVRAPCLGLASIAGCSSDDCDPPAGVVAPASATSDTEEFKSRTAGPWLLQFTIGNPAGSVYVNDRETFTEDGFTLAVEVFLDEARTTPFLRYEAAFTLRVVGRSPTVPNGFLVDIENKSASMTALVDDPALFTAFGLDDCGLVANQAVDVSRSACGSPAFRNGSCRELDIYQVAKDAREMFPAAGDDDRCVTRPSSVNPALPYKRL